MSFGRTVVLQSIQQEGRALLDQISLHEDIDNLAKRARQERNEDVVFIATIIRRQMQSQTVRNESHSSMLHECNRLNPEVLCF